MSIAHKMLPESTLLRFSKSGIFNYLNMDSNEILWARARKYETEEDYYSKEIEEFLCNEIERPLGQLNKSIELFIEQKGFLRIDHSLKEALVLCCAIQLHRVPDMMQNVKQNCIYCQFGKFEDKFFSPLHHGKEFVLDNITELRNTFLDYVANFCIIDEKCNLSFLLPSAHWFGGDNGMVFFVISPRTAFILLPQEVNKRFCFDNTSRYLLIEDENMMRSIYARELVSERAWQKPVLIGCKTDLMIAQEIFKTLPPKIADI